MRILLIQETNWIERNVIHQHHLAERLARRGHEVRVVDYDILWPQKDLRRRWQPRQFWPDVNRAIAGVSLPVTRPATLRFPLLCHLSWTASSLLELRRLLADYRPDVVVGLTLTNSTLMAHMLARAGVAYVSMVLEPYHTMMAERWARPLARAIEKRSLRAADHVVVFTPQMQRYVSEMGARPERVTLLKTGVSLDLFHPDVDGAGRRAELGLAPEQWVLLFMGWLYDFSGLLQIVQALAADPGLLDGARLLIVGDGDLYHELRGLVDGKELRDHVIMTGLRPYSDIPTLLAAADVCLLPSLENTTTREIVPMKVYEYLAAGKPLVASRLPGLVAEFGDRSGIVYADHPVDALHKAVALTGHPEQVRQLAAEGRRTAERNADWEKTTDRFEQLLASTGRDKQDTGTDDHE
ncbi:MAG TPA: glycosyltransferase family 4 protein [Anaerolineae bacterium]|nr:glycosyltransferase family 4 protein [Anaerolineae bacterium]